MNKEYEEKKTLPRQKSISNLKSFDDYTSDEEVWYLKRRQTAPALLLTEYHLNIKQKIFRQNTLPNLK